MAVPVLPLSAIVALTPTQLVANFPAILEALQRHHILLLPPPSDPSSSPSFSSPAASLHSRFLTKCLGLISQGQRASNPPEQWCGLQLLGALIRHSSPAALSPHYQQIASTLTELQKQAGYAGAALDVSLLECMAAVLCSAAEAGGEVRRDTMTSHLNKTVGSVIDRLAALLPASSLPSSTASVTATPTPTSTAALRRLLLVLDELLAVYVASLRSFSSRLQPLLTSLLLHCDESCLPPLLSCLTTLLASTTAAAAAQQSNKAKQARMQQAAQDTTDEVAQQKLTTATPQPIHTSSPYHTFATACLQQLTEGAGRDESGVGRAADDGWSEECW